MQGNRSSARSSDDAGKDLFSPVVSSRISASIVDQIRNLIHQGQLSPGDRLPSERELCTSFGVSRVTIRDALRVLESSGLIDIRVGAHGGAYVTAPSASNVSVGISDMLAMSSLSASEVTEARMVFELGIVDLVCARADENDLRELAELCERSQVALLAGAYTMELSAAFHVRLARCAHNRTIDLIVESFQFPLRYSLIEAQSAAPMMGDPGVAEHCAILEAIKIGDATTARTILSQHLGRTAERLAHENHPPLDMPTTAASLP